jgi:hypothetical protein
VIAMRTAEGADGESAEGQRRSSGRRERAQNGFDRQPQQERNLAGWRD